MALSVLHRFVRHPWYSAALVIIWTRDMDAARLLSAAMMTVYVVVGSRLEERKLVAWHGERYHRCRERVPGLVPLAGRVLTAREAARLVADAPREQPCESPRARKRGQGGDDTR